MKFKLYDENSDIYYSIDTNFVDVDDFLDWIQSDDDFQPFMDNMETGYDDWCGIHDGGNGYDGDVEFWQYSSYEIKDYNQAIQKWEEFFKSKNKMTNTETI